MGDGNICIIGADGHVLLDAVEREGAAAVVIDDFFDDIFLSAAAEQAVAATTIDFLALALFLVPAEPIVPSDVFLDEGIVGVGG